MTDHRHQLHQSLVAWAQTTQANTERRITRAMLVAMLNTSSIGGSFSGWLMAISGATLGLAFTEYESLLKVFSPLELRLAFAFLFGSCIAGFVARIAGSYVDLYRQMSAEMETTLLAILKELDKEEDEIEATARGMVEAPSVGLDMERVLTSVVEAFPKFMRSRTRKAMKKGQADPLYSYKRAVALYLFQWSMVTAQASLFGLFGVMLFFA